MFTAEAEVETDRPLRYLQQLRRHTGKMTGLRMRHGRRDGGEPPEIEHATWTGTSGTVQMKWGRWTVTASSDRLLLHAEAHTIEDLRRIQARVGSRVERIGRRDRLTVIWQPAHGGVRV